MAEDPPRDPDSRRCGTCVVRNGPDGLEFAGCAVLMEERHRWDPACRRWWPRHELNAALYGKRA